MVKILKSELIDSIHELESKIAERGLKTLIQFENKYYSVSAYLNKKETLEQLQKQLNKLTETFNLIDVLLEEQNIREIQLNYAKFNQSIADHLALDYKINILIPLEKIAEKQAKKQQKIDSKRLKELHAKGFDITLNEMIEIIELLGEDSNENWNIGFKHISVNDHESVNENAHKIKYMLHRANPRPAYNGPLAVLSKLQDKPIKESSEEIWLVAYIPSNEREMYANKPPSFTKGPFKGSGASMVSNGKRVLSIEKACKNTVLAESVILLTYLKTV